MADALFRLFAVKTSKRLSRTIIELTVCVCESLVSVHYKHARSTTYEVAARNLIGLADDSVNRRVKAVVVFHGKAEDGD